MGTWFSMKRKESFSSTFSMGAAGGVVIELKSLAGKGADADKLMVDDVERAFGIRNGAAGDEKAAVVGGGHDLEVGGVDDLDGVGEVGHQVGNEQFVGVEVGGDALHDGLLGEQRFVAVDHHIEVGLNLRGNFIEAFGGGFVGAGSHDYRGAERLAAFGDFIGVGGDVDFVEHLDFGAVGVDPLYHRFAENQGERFLEEAAAFGSGGNYTDDFHCDCDMFY